MNYEYYVVIIVIIVLLLSLDAFSACRVFFPPLFLPFSLRSHSSTLYPPFPPLSFSPRGAELPTPRPGMR